MKETLSVITICFNNLEDLVTTCHSVEGQTVGPFEHLIIDGSSNDEIVKWLTGSQQPAYRRWIHERDRGISDAFNKGVQAAKGTVTHILNSGDIYYTPEAIGTVLPFFEEDPALMWTHALYVQHRGGIDVISGVPFDAAKLWRGMRAIAHPSMFIRRSVYDRCGLYGIGYKIAMDYDMLVRMRNEKFRFIERPIVYFAPGGVSHFQFEKGLKEVKRSYRENIGSSTRMFFWQLRQRLLHRFMRTSLGKGWFGWKNRTRKILNAK